MNSLEFLDVVDSTNEYLKNILKYSKIDSGEAVVTFNQRKGNGQYGNKWASAPDKNVSYSLYVEPENIEIKDQFIISELVSISIVEFLKNFISDVTIKWPNDIYWKDKKICGILIENMVSGKNIDSCIIGAGINVNQVRFSPKIPNPVSLKMINKVDYSLDDMAIALHDKVCKAIVEKDLYTPFQIKKKYFSFLYRKSGFHKFKDAEGFFTARIIDIEPSGAMVLQKKDDSIKSYCFKEVEYVI